jgi:hypothetical protein
MADSDDKKDQIFEPKRPKFKNINRQSNLYRQLLRRDLRDTGRLGEQGYRAQAFGTLGAQQQQANQAGQQQLLGAFGMNQPTGLSSYLTTQNAMNADYGGANLGAQDARRKAMMGTGSELQNLYQRRANLYSTLVAPVLQSDALRLQQAALEAQNAMALAGMGGSGSSSVDWSKIASGGLQ